MAHIITTQDFGDMINEFDVRATYSGRAMYGKECFGLVGDVAALVQFIAYVARHQEDSMESPAVEWFAEDVRSDNMGMDMIFYWPNVQVDTGEADEMKV